jgi:hypothetical protein
MVTLSGTPGTAVVTSMDLDIRMKGLYRNIHTISRQGDGSNVPTDKCNGDS